jgi:hypothetical protein
LGGYLLAPPIIHLAHGRPLVALGSLGMRVALPIGGLYVADAACADHDYERCGDELAAGIGIGMLAAMAIDAAALSWETPEPAGTISIAPHPLPGGAALTAQGIF